jgi:hypothetical protein
MHIALRSLIISSILLGAGVLSVMLLLALRQPLRQNLVLRMTVIFGTVGIAIPLLLLIAIILRNGFLYMIAISLMPSSFMLMASHFGDPVWTALLVWSLAALSNIGVYGFLGLIAGVIWKWVRSAQIETRG